MKALMRFTTFILLTIFALLLANYRPTLTSRVPFTSTEFEFTAKVLEGFKATLPEKVFEVVVVQGVQEVIEYSEPQDDVKPNPTLNHLYIANSPPVSV